jgi:hypothetical protein
VRRPFGSVERCSTNDVFVVGDGGPRPFHVVLDLVVELCFVDLHFLGQRFFHVFVGLYFVDFHLLVRGGLHVFLGIFVFRFLGRGVRDPLRGCLC